MKQKKIKSSFPSFAYLINLFSMVLGMVHSLFVSLHGRGEYPTKRRAGMASVQSSSSLLQEDNEHILGSSWISLSLFSEAFTTAAISQSVLLLPSACRNLGLEKMN